MAAAKIKTTTKASKYIVTSRDDLDNSHEHTEVAVLDHPPEASDINNFIDYYGYEPEDVVVVELGKVGTVEREVIITFED